MTDQGPQPPGWYLAGVGHLGWSQHRAGLEAISGNDPKQPRAERELLFDQKGFHEGQTIIVLGFPGRFTDDAEVTRVAEQVGRAFIEAIN